MQTINATEFKAKCLDFLDRVGDPGIETVSITKHGNVVAWLVPPPPARGAVRSLHGFMRDAAMVADDADVTAPVLDEAWSVSDGVLHR